MASSSTKSAYFAGFRAAAPFVLAAFPFGALFGVVGTEAGLSLAQTMVFTSLVIAGAAQFTAVQLMVEQAPALIVIASALAVNLRMAMYAASLAPYLGEAPLGARILAAYFNFDQNFAVSMQKYEDEPAMPLGERLAYFFGATTPIAPTWIGATYLGAVFGTTIPASIPIDFALPITFLAMIGPALRTQAHIVAAVVSVVLALCLQWMPHNLWILTAGIGGMMAGAEAERRRAK